MIPLDNLVSTTSANTGSPKIIQHFLSLYSDLSLGWMVHSDFLRQRTNYFHIPRHAVGVAKNYVARKSNEGYEIIEECLCNARYDDGLFAIEKFSGQA
ncbi:hypothetical protein TNCT_307021 [Trichonephila clavata]|uniref:Uncharacterized protein n=1 Tax=Trichonephila clavata TaxID=2740835 RepID=A0A8X6HH62_TRICU|nr:hypothetical protein TNCT_307021 [Trichonephila clavata]